MSSLKLEMYHLSIIVSNNLFTTFIILLICSFFPIFCNQAFPEVASRIGCLYPDNIFEYMHVRRDVNKVGLHIERVGKRYFKDFSLSQDPQDRKTVFLKRNPEGTFDISIIDVLDPNKELRFGDIGGLSFYAYLHREMRSSLTVEKRDVFLSPLAISFFSSSKNMMIEIYLDDEGFVRHLEKEFKDRKSVLSIDECMLSRSN